VTIPSNGITPGVFRDTMPAYHLSLDLMNGTFAALPPPPLDAPAGWRHERITRLIGEIVAFRPADAAQARLAAQILIARELADTLTRRVHALGATVEEMCRLSRASGELMWTATLLLRTLERCQQYPVPFYGTVVDDEVDIAAVDAAWGRDARQRPAAGLRSGGKAVPDVPPGARAAVAARGVEPEPVAGAPDAAALAADAMSHGLFAASNAANDEAPAPNAATFAVNVEPLAVNAAPPAVDADQLRR